MDGWKTIHSFLEGLSFQVRTISCREGRYIACGSLFISLASEQFDSLDYHPVLGASSDVHVDHSIYTPEI